MKTRLLTLFCMVVATLLFQITVPAGAAELRQSMWGLRPACSVMRITTTVI